MTDISELNPSAALAVSRFMVQYEDKFINFNSKDGAGHLTLHNGLIIIHDACMLIWPYYNAQYTKAKATLRYYKEIKELT